MGDKSQDIYKAMNIVNYKTSDSSHTLTSRTGLVVLGELLKRLKLNDLIERLMPKAQRNRAYRSSTVFNTFMLMLHEGAKCLDDVRLLRQESALMGMLGIKQLPSAHTLGNWLRAVGSNQGAMRALDEVNRKLLKAALHDRKKVVLDIDATVIEAHKKDAKYTYKKHPGYVPMVGHIAETGQVVATEFRAGNVPPNKANLEFIQRCEQALPEGVSVSRVRIDAAGYQADLINYCESNDICFAIRAKMDKSLKESMTAIKDSQWQALVRSDGSVSETEQVARTLHTMVKTELAFTVVVQRQLIGESEQDPQQDLLPGLLGDVDEESVSCGVYMYRAIATNLDGDKLTDHEVVQFYNQRADASENRLKELRSDFAGAHLPCSDFDANGAYFKLSAIAYNLWALMRMILPVKWERCRATTVRYRLYASAGQIVRHARQWTLKLNASRRGEIEEAIWSIRNCVLT